MKLSNEHAFTTQTVRRKSAKHSAVSNRITSNGINVKQLISVTLLGIAITLSGPASAGLFDKAKSTVSKGVTTLGKAAPKPPSPQKLIAKIDAVLNSMPKPREILGGAQQTVFGTVADAAKQVKKLGADIKTFKGDDCSGRSDCRVLKDRLLGIYRGLRGIRDVVPGYDILPDPAALVGDPVEGLIKAIPPIALYGLNVVVGRMDNLNNIENFSQWIDELHFYKLQPIEEDNFYRLPQEECDALEYSIYNDNEKFNAMKNAMDQVSLVTYMAMSVVPNDIVINAWVGTNIPNPIYPVLVLMNKQSKDFGELLDAELEARRTQVKQCRQQVFKQEVNEKLDFLLGN